MFRFVLVITFSTALVWASLKVPNDGKIVGGQDTTIEAHPYHLSLEMYQRRQCGASLIAPDIALTAAHCATLETAEYWRVRGGLTNFSEPGVIGYVKTICTHPKYVHDRDYDISVLQLNDSLPLSDRIRVIGVQSAGVEVADGTVANATGWGRLSTGGVLPETLQRVEVPQVNHDVCVENYKQIHSVTDRMHCYGYPGGGKDSCQGDSGGPLVINGVQVGISSWGRGCGRPNLPGVYVKLSNQEIHDFIEDCISNFTRSTS